MDTDRLLNVLSELEDEVDEGYDDRLGTLIKAYTAARDTPAQDHSKAIETAIGDLREHLRQAPQNGYPPSKLAILRRLNATELFGDAALNRIDAIFREAHSGPATVVKRLEAFRVELTEFSAAAADVRKGLAAMGLENDDAPPDLCEVGVLIPTRMTDAKLGPLTEQMKKWNQILRTFAELAGDSEREVSVRAISTGSVELYLYAAIGTASLVVTALDKLADLYKKILEIQLLRNKLSDAGAPVQEAEAVKEHERRMVKSGVEELVKDLFKQTTTKFEAGRRSELKVQMKISITQMAEFIDAGGSVEVAEPAQESDAPAGATESGAENASDGVESSTSDARSLARARDIERIRSSGAVLASLPARSQPILQLPSPAETPPEAASEKDGPPSV